MTAILVSLSLVGGVLLGTGVHVEPWIVGLAVLPLLMLPVVKKRRLLVRVALVLAALFSGASLVSPSAPLAYPSQVQFYNDAGMVIVRGLVKEPPEPSGNSAHILLRSSAVDSGEGWQDVSGNILITTNRYPQYNYGDVLELTGKVQSPKAFSDFDYPAYLAQQEIYSVMTYPEVTLVATGQGSKAIGLIHSLRAQLASSLAQVLPEPQSALAQSLTLGVREGLPQSVVDNFAGSGLSHLLAISGLHLGIIAGISSSLGRRLFGRRGYRYVWFGLGGVWAYAILSGMSPPVMRAAIMASTFLVADLFGRQHSGPISLALAAAIMVAINPLLVRQASFQMSFAAVAGVIFVTPLIGGEKVNYTERGGWGSLRELARDSLAVSIGALLAVGPVILYHFGELALLSPLSSMLTVPVLPAVILTSGLSALLGLMALPVAQLVGWISWPLLSYLLLVAQGFAVVPFSIKLGPLSPLFIAAYYLMLGLAIWSAHKPQALTSAWKRLGGLSQKGLGATSRFLHQERKWVIVGLVVVVVLGSITVLFWPTSDLRVTFIDVGQGDAILIQQGSTQVLIDGGPSPEALLIALGEEMPFWDRKIELVVLSHPHADHLAGLVEVVGRYQVDKVMQPELSADTPLYEEWLRVIDEKDIPIITACEGVKIELGKGTSLAVLSPPQTDFYDKPHLDENSLTAYLLCGKVSFLFTGDIGIDTELELSLKRLIPDCTVLKVAHHGSSGSTSSRFLAQARPEVAVISVGADNPFGLPAPETTQRLEAALGADNVYRTDLSGDIAFKTDGERLWIKTER